jgi:predicted RNA-binding protein with TRAM domain
MEVERRLRTLGAGSRAQAFRVEVNPRTAALLIGPGAARLAEVEAVAKKRFFLVPKEGVHADHAAVLAEGKLDDLRPEASLEEGAEVDVKLVELDRHDGQAAVGKLDGLDVVVGRAARLIGKKAKVRVERVLEGTAYAQLVAGGQAAAEPITFESEAEKPTRTPRAKKAAEPDAPQPEAVAVEDDATEVAEPEEAPAVGEAESVDADEEVAADGAAEKKKTRRGSRGGRGRKKKPAAEEGAAIAADEPDAGAEVVVEAKPRSPRIHVPADDLGGDEAPQKPAIKPRRSRAKAQAVSETEKGLEAKAAEPDELEPAEADADASVELDESGEPKPKKKTRRGSRGGRNRKKKPAAGVSDNGAEAGEGAEAVATEPDEPIAEASGNGAEETRAGETRSDDYVPMSEWLDEIET